MGFLRFLNRKKEEDLSELDLPPAPPSLEGFEDNLEFELPESKETTSAKDFPYFDFPEIENAPELKEELPEFPNAPETEEMQPPIPPITASLQAKPQPIMMQEPEKETEDKYADFKPSDFSPETGEGLFRPKPMPEAASEMAEGSKETEQVIRSGKTVYLKVEKFKVMLGLINIVRNDLRKSDDALMKLENIKTSSDKLFNKVKSSLDDLQRKLIFVDKTLFKGY